MAHGGGYGEGMTLIDPRKLDRYDNALKAKALILMPEDWMYEDKRIGFTAKNLAKRMFKSESFEARAKALALQQTYFDVVKEERKFQKIVLDFINTHQIDNKPFIRSATSRILKLNTGGERDIKQALSFIGAGESADYATESCLELDAYCELHKPSFWPVLFIHDEILCECYRSDVERNALILKTIMETPKEILPGFSCPVKIQKGENWYEKEMEEVVV